jgi:H+/Cl- antiporter ClcA
MLAIIFAFCSLFCSALNDFIFKLFADKPQSRGIFAILVGVVWTVVMAFLCNGYRDLGAEAMLMSALTCVGVELLLVFLSTLLINTLVILHFDRKGTRRSEQV